MLTNLDIQAQADVPTWIGQAPILKQKRLMQTQRWKQQVEVFYNKSLSIVNFKQPMTTAQPPIFLKTCTFINNDIKNIV